MTGNQSNFKSKKMGSNTITSWNRMFPWALKASSMLLICFLSAPSRYLTLPSRERASQTTVPRGVKAARWHNASQTSSSRIGRCQTASLQQMFSILCFLIAHSFLFLPFYIAHMFPDAPEDGDTEENSCDYCQCRPDFHQDTYPGLEQPGSDYKQESHF